MEEQKYKTIKQLDTAVQEISDEIKGIRSKLQGLATQEAINELVGVVQGLYEKIGEEKGPPQSPQLGDDAFGSIEDPKGDYFDKNPDDPTMHIEIYMVPSPGRIPKVLTFMAANGKDQIRYAPKFDKEKRAHYYLPRRFAEAQLKNDCGMKFGLCWPNELSIVMRGEKMRKEQRNFVADPNCPAILVERDGTPIR